LGNCETAGETDIFKEDIGIFKEDIGIFKALRLKMEIKSKKLINVID
jgi:hypothetical protein